MNAEPVAVVVGRNARSIRLAGDVTLAQVAKVATFYGLAWTTGRVAAFESGRVSPTLPTLLAAAAVLGDVTEKPVRLADLLVGDGRVQITDRLTMDLAAVRATLDGEPVSDLEGGQEAVAAIVTAGRQALTELAKQVERKLKVGQLRSGSKLLSDFSDADFKVAKSLGVDRIIAAAAMADLWEKTFVAERDQRAGPGANPQRKGRIARELKDDLGRWLDGND